MSWKEFIKDQMTYKKPTGGWPETSPNYVGIAEEDVKFPCLKEEEKTYFNYAMEETCKFVNGVVLRVAKYKGQYFFGCDKYYGDSACFGAISIDVDAELIKAFHSNPPEHAYHVNPHIAVTKPKEEIINFAKSFILYEIRNYEKLREYAKGAVKLFAEAI